MNDTQPAPVEDVRADLEAAFDQAEKPAARERAERAAPERAARERNGVSHETREKPALERENSAETVESAESQEKLAPPEGDRPRDQFGRFLSSTPPARAAAPEEPDETPGETDDTTDQPAPKEDEPDHRPAIAPPQSWSAAAKDTWGQLPRTVQDEVLRRESDVARGFQQRAEQINHLEPIAQAVAPYAQKFALRGASPAAAVQQLLAVQDLLERDPIEGVAHVARSYGVDLRQFAAAVAQAQQPQDPQVQAVASRLERMESLVRQQSQAAEQAEMTRIGSEIEAFRADAAAHPYFEAVRPAMAQLMANNIALTLQDAYDHACWAIPQVRSRILDDQKRAEQVQRGKVDREAAERARRAAVSVSSAPSSGRGGNKTAIGKSIRDDLEAAFDRVTR
jgi:hypothetical protein